ncbi:MAG: DUF4349 domain-containing protein [Candidatus Cloacimonetes bacterium]|nr:DUF4349 domain-containing protein [Candidatus Cloacimonadota bacterium]MCF7814988.1 DUF4349 domain-containing protein [Candidatus Cloacimonadota bacterium]MCF7868404.1 DUF4349 domain-containing protein [Candidatus Cloacimonadota bacterium]MCF7883877.1 DUF4349 domain-containing protein [Candidatus Cloacimonadota bacterium]
MKIHLRKETKLIIVLFIFLVSIYVGYKSSHITRIFLPKQTTVDTKEADKLFENAKNQRKITMQFRSKDDTQIRNLINELTFMDGVTTKYSDSKKNYQLFILEVPNQKIENEIKKLRQLPGLESEHIKSSTGVGVDTNVKENLENYKITKNRLQDLINKTSSPLSLAKFQADLERAQSKIDSLNSFVAMQERLVDHDILYISSINQTASSVSPKKVIWKFVYVTILTMLFLILCFVLLYLLTVAITNLMSAMGIRTSRGSGSSSTYKYGDYKSSYGRKVKRIYKDKDGKRREEVSKEK